MTLRPSDELTDDEDPFLKDCMENLQPPRSESNISDVAKDGLPATASKAEPIESGIELRESKRVLRESHPVHLATSTFLSLVMVLALLLVARLVVPSLVEDVRYGWYRGQLRAEYELSGERLKNVSLDSLADVSQLVSQRMGPSVVHVNQLRDTETLDQFKSLFHGPPNVRYEGQGSGFIFDSKGHILTNHHVVEGNGKVEVTLSDGRQLLAEVIGIDKGTDLAVLKIDADGLLAAEWGDSDEIVVGTPVWAVGSPFGLQQTVTFGILSGKHRVDFRTTSGGHAGRGGSPYEDMMQSDVALNPGNSGGPLVNSLGRVVGVNAAILGDNFLGVSFSIPSKVARRVADHLISEGQVPRGWLGVELRNLLPEEKYDEDGSPRVGVRVVQMPDPKISPARRSGIQVGDLIVSFEGTEIRDTANLIRLIGESPVGKTVAIEIDRDSIRLEFQVQLERRDPSLELRRSSR